MILSEGTSSYYKGILDFKRGAFTTEQPIKLYVIQFETQIIKILLNIFS